MNLISLQLHERLKRPFAWCWTEPKEKIHLVALCIRDYGMEMVFSFLSLSVKSSSNSVSIWLYIFNAVARQRTLHAIHESLSELLFFDSLRKRTKSDNIQSKESTACAAYLLFVQRITIDRFPAVFRWDSISKIWPDSDLTCRSNNILSPSVAVLCLCFSATWNTLVCYLAGLVITIKFIDFPFPS